MFSKIYIYYTYYTYIHILVCIYIYIYIYTHTHKSFSSIPEKDSRKNNSKKEPEKLENKLNEIGALNMN